MRDEIFRCDICGRGFSDRHALAYSIAFAGRGDGFVLNDVCASCIARARRYIGEMVRRVEVKREVLGGEPVRRPAVKKK